MDPYTTWRPPASVPLMFSSGTEMARSCHRSPLKLPGASQEPKASPDSAVSGKEPSAWCHTRSLDPMPLEEEHHEMIGMCAFYTVQIVSQLYREVLDRLPEPAESLAVV